MDKQQLLQYWAGELLAVKMELRKIGFLMEEGLYLPNSIRNQLDRLLDRKNILEKLIKEIEEKD